MKNPSFFHKTAALAKKASDLSKRRYYPAAYSAYSSLASLFESNNLPDNAFSAECKAIRCLKEMALDAKSRQFFLTTANDFLQRYADTKTGERIYAATKVAFHAADIQWHLRQRQGAVTRQLISELKSYVKQAPGLTNVDRLIVVIDLAFQELKADISEGLKPEEVGTRLIAFADALKVQLPHATVADVEPMREFCLSCAHKFISFGILTESGALDGALGSMRVARMHARRCIQKAPTKFRRRACHHLDYIRYWLAVIRERQAIILAMEDPERASDILRRATRCWRMACQVSTRFEPRDFFPNRFYSPQDLSAEIHFIRACAAAAQHRFADAANELTDLLKQIETLHKHTWRYNNILVRQVFLAALASALQEDTQVPPQKLAEAELLTIVEPLGAAARELSKMARAADSIKHLTTEKGALLQILWNPLRKTIPLDASATEAPVTIELERPPREPLRGVPSVIAFGLRERFAAGYDAYASRQCWLQEIAPALRAYFLILLDYRSQRGQISVESIQFDKPPTALADVLAAAGQIAELFRDERDQQIRNEFFSTLKRLIEIARSNAKTVDGGDLEAAWQKVVAPTLPFFPCVIRIQDEARVEPYVTYACFAADPFALEKERTAITLWGDSRSGFSSTPVVGRVYYLPTKWRWGTRFSYRIDVPEHSLFPSRIPFFPVLKSVVSEIAGPNILDQMRARVFEDCVADWARPEFHLQKVHKRHHLPLRDGPEVDVLGEIVGARDQPVFVLILECKLCISPNATVGRDKAEQLVRRVVLARSLWPEAQIKGILISNGEFDSHAIEVLGQDGCCEAYRAVLTTGWFAKPDWKISRVERKVSAHAPIGRQETAQPVP
jgi:hypothetical protein